MQEVLKFWRWDEVTANYIDNFAYQEYANVNKFKKVIQEFNLHQELQIISIVVVRVGMATVNEWSKIISILVILLLRDKELEEVLNC